MDIFLYITISGFSGHYLLELTFRTMAIGTFSFASVKNIFKAKRRKGPQAGGYSHDCNCLHLDTFVIVTAQLNLYMSWSVTL